MTFAVDRDRLRTLCAHAGAPHDRERNEPFVPPIVQASLYQLGTTENAAALFSGEKAGFTYSRFGNPTAEKLAEVLAALEGGSQARVTSSGNAATMAALTMALRGGGDRIVAPPGLYGGTLELLRLFEARFGVPIEIADPAQTANWEAAIAKATVVFVETPTNPLLRIIPLAETAAAAHKAGATLIVDNTVATPYNQLPLQLGADFVIHSLSKYLNGHSDVVGGAVISREPFTRAQRDIHKNLGGTVNGFDAWLVLRGLRTFPLRMDAHNRNAQTVAEWLARHPAVSRVHYPGLPDHPGHALAVRQMAGFSGLLSFELAGGLEAARKLIDHLQRIAHAVSLGGVESSITAPAATSHRGIPAEERRAAGLADGLVRLSVGVEAVADLLADLDQALGQ